MKTLLCTITMLTLLYVAAGDEKPDMNQQNFTFRSIAPTIPVRDVSASLRFYRDVLGFRVEHTADDPPVYAVLRRDDVGVHLAREPGKAGHGGCWITVENVDAVYGVLDRAGAGFARRIKDCPTACATSW